MLRRHAKHKMSLIVRHQSKKLQVGDCRFFFIQSKIKALVNPQKEYSLHTTFCITVIEGFCLHVS